MIVFFATRRFNYVDVFAASYVVSEMAKGNFLTAAAGLIFGILLSVGLEELASGRK